MNYFQMMFVMASSFSYIILMMFMGFKFMILGDDAVNLLVTLTMLFYSMIIVSFMFGIAIMGHSVCSEVSYYYSSTQFNVIVK